jgi:hypothetical protein
MTIPDWSMVVHPLELYGVLTLSASCLLYMFILHLRMRSVGRKAREFRENTEKRLAGLSEAADRMRAELAEAVRPQSIPMDRAINLTKRGQALRMLRRGEGPETIAAALAVPRNEIDLMIKVHEMAVDRAM